MKNTLGVLALVLSLLPACSDQDPAAPGMDLVDGPALAKIDAKVKLGSSGPYPVGFTSFVVADESRDGRLVPVYVWYPANPDGIDGATPEAMYPLDPFHAGAPEAPSSAFEAQGLDPAYQEPEPAAGPFALVLHSPGWGGNAYTDAHYIGTGLASQGFVVASMTHWGDQSTFGFSGEPLFHLALSSFHRPRDVSFALDALLAKNSDEEDVLFGAMDPGQVIASGWSLGGYAAMVLVAGDDEVCDLAIRPSDPPAPPETCAPSHPDPRISAIIPIDGSNQVLHFHELARVNVPAMGIGQEWTTVGSWQARQHAAFSGHPAYRVDVFGAAHPSFSHLCAGWAVMGESGVIPAWFADYLGNFCPFGDIDPDEAHRLVLKYMLAFLTHDQRVLTPGHAITSEPAIEFFVSERRSPRSIRVDQPPLFVYHMHQPGKAHASAFKDLVATAETDPTGPRPTEFAFLELLKGGF